MLEYYQLNATRTQLQRNQYHVFILLSVVCCQILPHHRLRFTNVLLLDKTVGVIPQQICVGKIQQFHAILFAVVIVVVWLARCPRRELNILVGRPPGPQILAINIVTRRPVVEDLETIHCRCSIRSSFEILLQLLIFLTGIDL